MDILLATSVLSLAGYYTHTNPAVVSKIQQLVSNRFTLPSYQPPPGDTTNSSSAWQNMQLQTAAQNSATYAAYQDAAQRAGYNQTPGLTYIPGVNDDVDVRTSVQKSVPEAIMLAERPFQANYAGQPKAAAYESFSSDPALADPSPAKSEPALRTFDAFDPSDMFSENRALLEQQASLILENNQRGAMPRPFNPNPRVSAHELGYVTEDLYQTTEQLNPQYVPTDHETQWRKSFDNYPEKLPLLPQIIKNHGVKSFTTATYGMLNGGSSLVLPLKDGAHTRAQRDRTGIDKPRLALPTLPSGIVKGVNTYNGEKDVDRTMRTGYAAPGTVGFTRAMQCILPEKPSLKDLIKERYVAPVTAPIEDHTTREVFHLPVTQRDLKSKSTYQGPADVSEFGTYQNFTQEDDIRATKRSETDSWVYRGAEGPDKFLAPALNTQYGRKKVFDAPVEYRSLETFNDNMNLDIVQNDVFRNRNTIK